MVHTGIEIFTRLRCSYRLRYNKRCNKNKVSKFGKLHSREQPTMHLTLFACTKQYPPCKRTQPKGTNYAKCRTLKQWAKARWDMLYKLDHVFYYKPSHLFVKKDIGNNHSTFCFNFAFLCVGFSHHNLCFSFIHPKRFGKSWLPPLCFVCLFVFLLLTRNCNTARQ